MMIFHSHFYSAETNTFFSTAKNKLCYVLNMCPRTITAKSTIQLFEQRLHITGVDSLCFTVIIILFQQVFQQSTVHTPTPWRCVVVWQSTLLHSTLSLSVCESSHVLHTGCTRQDVSIDQLSIGQRPHQHYLPLPSPMSALLTPTRAINIIYQYHICIIF